MRGEHRLNSGVIGSEPKTSMTIRTKPCGRHGPEFRAGAMRICAVRFGGPTGAHLQTVASLAGSRENLLHSKAAITLGMRAACGDWRSRVVACVTSAAGEVPSRLHRSMAFDSLRATS